MYHDAEKRRTRKYAHSYQPFSRTKVLQQTEMDFRNKLFWHVYITSVDCLSLHIIRIHLINQKHSTSTEQTNICRHYAILNN